MKERTEPRSSAVVEFGEKLTKFLEENDGDISLIELWQCFSSYAAVTGRLAGLGLKVHLAQAEDLYLQTIRDDSEASASQESVMNCAKCGRETVQDGARGTETEENVTSVLCVYCSLLGATKAAGLDGSNQKIVVGALGKMFQVITGRGSTEARFGQSLTEGCYQKALEFQKKRPK